jgi:hypothetical protein
MESPSVREPPFEMTEREERLIRRAVGPVVPEGVVAATVIVKLGTSEFGTTVVPLGLVKVSVGVYVPAWVGVPAITPVDELMVKPGGRPEAAKLVAG